ncbi:AfsR/SARP family transcriptional regulator [Nocardia higoensis]|uniref:AfsR/SARP family transcriptional regulator n=1 Tax=Nocardia higoensis TaxID=228599 RepID=A0ABS0DFB7_9NOCA|nr:BTAD domain-containing putative transcriptional regulator [Nocardia higoensis]MBF6357162.1 AfsR/SARP family transcriptional regulator [Nocardia higoensis]
MEQPGRFRIDVLGPLRVRTPEGAEITPGGALPRRLLALLTLRRGKTVTIDAVIELLWPTDGPNDPVAALHNHVARLRRSLPGLIVRAPEGYRLDPARVDVDADVLAAALAEPGDSGASRVGDILDRWRGPAYPELEDYDAARAEAVYFDELRTRAREFVAERRLAAQDTDGLAAQVRALVDEYPLRERPRALLMDALVATGRHADALRVYDEFRRLLADELAVDPSPELAARHRRILDSGEPGEWAPQSLLPMPPTSLVGREQLLTELAALAAECRLLTLVGPGGVGKTRLLLELGHRLTESGPVVLCELGRVEAAGAGEAIAAALRIDSTPGVPIVDRITGVVRDGALVLLLDNCEHVLEPVAALVERLTGRCPGVRIVTTSRERLRAPGEFVRHIPPLAFDSSDAAGVRLFVERARAVSAEPVTDPAARARIAAIVARLDGLPLAIELAAARMFSHDLDEIAAGLDQRFDFLSNGYRTSERHGSLSAAVAWSFTLLDEPLRRAFSALSIFGGPFETDGAAAVCGVSRPVAADLLGQLSERSLVMRYPGRRYVLLETLRAFGREQLAAGNQWETVAGRHAAHMLAWAERAHDRLALPGSSAIREIDEAVGELQRALEWLLGHDRADAAGRLVAALFDYGLLRLRPDVLGWAEQVIAVLPAEPGSLPATLWAATAYGAWMVGDVRLAGERADTALRIARAAGESVPTRVFSANGVCELFAGHLDAAAHWYRLAAEEADVVGDHIYRLIPHGTDIMVRSYVADAGTASRAAELADALGDDTSPYAAYAWYCAGEAVLDSDPALARERLDRAVRLAELTDAALVTGVATASRASLEVRAGRLREATQAYQPLVEHWRRVGMWAKQWVMLRSVALLFEGLARYEDAALLEGAIRAAETGQRVAGADDIALDELATRLRQALGDERFEAAHRRGETLDHERLVGHVLDCLSTTP